MSGKGAGLLREAGKTTQHNNFGLQTDLEELAEIFLMNIRHKRPFVAIKVASSLDGKIALPDGSSKWITGAESRAHVQHLRGCYDAVVTGLGTFRRDNPQLNSRDPKFEKNDRKLFCSIPEGIHFLY